MCTARGPAARRGARDRRRDGVGADHEAREKNERAEGCHRLVPGRRRRRGLVLRRALGHDAVGLDLKALRRQRALQHHLGFVLERVWHDAGVRGIHDLPLALDLEAVLDRARAAGDSVSAIHLHHISPLPPGLENIFSGFHHILVIEMNDKGIYNYGGQLASILRARFCNPAIRGINKTDGLTWKVREIIERAKTVVNTGVRKL